MTSRLRAAYPAMAASSRDSGKAVSIVWLKRRKRKSELPYPFDTGSAFLAEMGELKNFKSCKSLIAFMGLDPSTNQSGQRDGPGKISNRGNRHLRRVIHIMTLWAIRSDNIFREYYLRRKAEGLPPMKALMATSHKLIRVIFSMLTHKMSFKKEVAAV